MSTKSRLIIKRGILSQPIGKSGPISVNKNGLISVNVKSSNIDKDNNVKTNKKIE